MDAKHPTHLSDMVQVHHAVVVPVSWLLLFVCIFTVVFSQRISLPKAKVLINNVESNCRSWTVLLVKTFLSCYINSNYKKKTQDCSE